MSVSVIYQCVTNYPKTVNSNDKTIISWSSEGWLDKYPGLAWGYSCDCILHLGTWLIKALEGWASISCGLSSFSSLGSTSLHSGLGRIKQKFLVHWRPRPRPGTALHLLRGLVKACYKASQDLRGGKTDTTPSWWSSHMLETGGIIGDHLRRQYSMEKSQLC